MKITIEATSREVSLTLIGIIATILVGAGVVRFVLEMIKLVGR